VLHIRYAQCIVRSTDYRTWKMLDLATLQIILINVRNITNMV
jgi:hypothetical protein